MTPTVLITGVAGFIGFHAAKTMIEHGFHVVGIDNVNDYYSTTLKRNRLSALSQLDGFSFQEVDITDMEALKKAASGVRVTYILHLAAQAGVRYSIENPSAYAQSNLVGHLNMLELARSEPDLKHFVYASSSSVYGDREDAPFCETDPVRKPASLYAATKLGGEMLSESYWSLYNIPQTGLRFFTVYGPWGRPDMAYFIFTQKILRGESITLFAPEEMSRDFTYIDDITNTFPAIVAKPPKSGHKIYNLGNNKPNTLMELVGAVERTCERKAKIEILPKQEGDVSQTFANIDAAQKDFGFRPSTSLEEGIGRFVRWYKDYY